MSKKKKKFSINRQKYIIHTNIDKIMKTKMTKNIQTWTNTWQQNLLSSLTYSNNNKNTEKYKKHGRTSSESWEKQLQQVTQ